MHSHERTHTKYLYNPHSIPRQRFQGGPYSRHDVLCPKFRRSSAVNAIHQPQVLPTYTGQHGRSNNSRHASTTKVGFEPTTPVLRYGQYMCQCQCKVVLVHAMKVHGGSGDVAPLILYLGTRGR